MSKSFLSSQYLNFSNSGTTLIQFNAFSNQLEISGDSTSDVIVKVPNTNNNNSLIFKAGSAVSGNNNGGDLYFEPGLLTGAGSNGQFIVKLANNSNFIIKNSTNQNVTTFDALSFIVNTGHNIGNSTTITNKTGALNVYGTMSFFGSNSSGSIQNCLSFNDSFDVDVPTSSSSRSVGTRIILYPDAVDYSIGLESQGMWFSVPSSNGYKWYTNLSSIMSLSSAGHLTITNLTVNGTITNLTITTADIVTGNITTGNITTGNITTVNSFNIDNTNNINSNTITASGDIDCLNIVTNSINSINGESIVSCYNNLTVGTFNLGSEMIGGTINIANGEESVTAINILNGTTPTGYVNIGSTKNPANSNDFSGSSGCLNLEGALCFYGTNSSGSCSNCIYFDPGSTVNPTFSNRSDGTRIVLFPTLASDAVDYAIGMGPASMWFSVQNSTRTFRWYGGITEMMSLSSNTLTIPIIVSNDLNATATNSTVYLYSNLSASAIINLGIGMTTNSRINIGTSMTSGQVNIANGTSSVTEVNILIGSNSTGYVTIGSTKNPGNDNGTFYNSSSLNIKGSLCFYGDGGNNANCIYFSTSGTVNPPTTLNRSYGSRVVLNSSVAVSSVDTAIGIEMTGMWFSVESLSNTFKWYGGVTEMMSLSNGILSLPLQPRFFAYLNANVNNVTGNGATATFIPNIVVTDITSSYNNLTGVFTAPVSGFYQFNVLVSFINITASHTNGFTYLDINGTQLRLDGFNPAAIRSPTTPPSYCFFNGSCSVYVNSGNTVSVKAVITGSGSNDADFHGNASYISYFSGYLISG